MKLTFIFTDTPNLAELSKYDIYKTQFDFPDEALQLPDCEDRLLTIAQQVGALTQACLHVTCKEVGWRNRLVKNKPPSKNVYFLRYVRDVAIVYFKRHTIYDSTYRKSATLKLKVMSPIEPPHRSQMLRQQRKETGREYIQRMTKMHERYNQYAPVNLLNDTILSLLGTNENTHEQIAHRYEYVGFVPWIDDNTMVDLRNKRRKQREKEQRQAEKDAQKANAKKKRTGQIYFIQQGDDGPIKIGYSTNPEKRLKTLQTASPFPLKLLLTIEGGKTKEQAFHDQFAAYQLDGEWFRPVDVLLATIRELESS